MTPKQGQVWQRRTTKTARFRDDECDCGGGGQWSPFGAGSLRCLPFPCVTMQTGWSVTYLSVCVARCYFRADREELAVNSRQSHRAAASPGLSFCPARIQHISQERAVFRPLFHSCAAHLKLQIKSQLTSWSRTRRAVPLSQGRCMICAGISPPHTHGHVLRHCTHWWFRGKLSI